LSQTLQIILGLVFVAGVFVLSQFIVARRLQRAAWYVTADLERLNAFDASSAVALDYAKPNLLRIGLRDMRPRAIEDLVQGRIVGKTAAGTFFLINRQAPFAVHGAGHDPATGRR